MKKMLLLAGVASVFAFNANAFDFNPYLSAKVKYAFTDSSVNVDSQKFSLDKDLIGGSGALGVKFPFASGAFRIEAEYTRTDDAKKKFRGENQDERAELRVQALMFNAYYDFSTNTPLSPYVTAGMGGARMKFSAGDEAIHQTELAWQLGFGVSYEFCEHLSADLGYRYINYGEFSDDVYGERTKVKSQANEIALGVRYTF